MSLDIKFINLIKLYFLNSENKITYWKGLSYFAINSKSLTTVDYFLRTISEVFSNVTGNV
jgi:hypothetical protein